MRDSSIGFNRKSVSDGVPMLFGVSIRMYLSSTVAEVVLTLTGETGGSCQRLHGFILFFKNAWWCPHKMPSSLCPPPRPKSVLTVTNRGTNVTGDKWYHGIYVVHQAEV